MEKKYSLFLLVKDILRSISINNSKRLSEHLFQYQNKTYMMSSILFEL